MKLIIIKLGQHTNYSLYYPSELLLFILYFFNDGKSDIRS